MKIVLTGSLGNISKPLLKTLIDYKKQVVVISSKQEKAEKIIRLGAQPAIGSLEDVSFLKSTFKDVDAVYAMIPPNYHESNSLIYYMRIANNYKKALENSNVKKLIFLSSWGAHLEQGTGTILGSHHAEKILNQLKRIEITHIRPVSLMYNLFGYINMIKNYDFIGSNFRKEDKIAWVHPEDVALSISEVLLEKGAKEYKIKYVAGDEKTLEETASIIGNAIGNDDLQWITFKYAEVVKSLISNGLSEGFACDIVDINACISSGKLGEDYQKNKPKLGKIKLENFAIEFANAFNNKN